MQKILKTGTCKTTLVHEANFVLGIELTTTIFATLHREISNE